KKYGRIDGLVNNAGRLDRCTIESIDDDLFDEIMIINTRAPIMLIKAALPHMEKQLNGGSIVNIGSVHAHGGAAKVLLYSMTKAALMTATRNLGNALSQRLVRVNQMNVGWTETENEHKIQASEGKPKNWLDNISKTLAPTGKILTSLQVAEHVAFWLSIKSAPVTGQVVDIEQYPIIGRF
ncbi:MAG: SDR family oxidoreductase, partial [Kordiimonadaceae bacterium]|nr:SDR family oxidoreductase [Kordiimonadaceae bacterium]